jgi:hypothetical protein
MKCYFIVFLLCYSFYTNAQVNQTIIALNRNDTISCFTSDSVRMKFPLSGGFNYVQAGKIDLNGDNVLDILLFDRSGDRLTPLIYTGTPGNPEYAFDNSLVYSFPKTKHFLVVKDFNCDGKSDLFTYENSGFKVYKNISTVSSGLQFELYTESLQSYFNPATLPIYCIPVDIPVIEDMDNDGDIDLMVFGILGTCVEYHKNTAMEELGRCDTLMLKLESNNWGLFTENFSTNDVVLNDSCDYSSGKYSANRHAGSSMLAFDSDGDGDKDLLLGDIAYRTMVKLTNGGTSTNALITSSLSPFPENTTFVNLPIFPAAFYIDIDQDGKRDLLVSPNNEGGSENNQCIWYYHNDGLDNSPVFTFQKKTLFVEESYDFGEGAIPVFFDYNGDGKTDIVVGNYGYFQPAGTYKSQLALLENISTNESPKYKLVTNDFAGLSALSGNSLNYHPSFGDLDGDGDQDMLVGTSDGRIFHYTNNAALGNNANFVFTNPYFQNIDVGTFASPQLVDVDLDGLLDLLIGSREGKINYYRNTGTPNSMSLELITNALGGISTTIIGDPSGFSTPSLFRKNGITYIICGSQSGIFKLYGNVDGNLDGNFALEDSLLLGDRNGERTSISLKDLDGDGLLDAVTGNYAGGICYYTGIFPNNINQSKTTSDHFNIFPNPGSTLNIESANEQINSVSIIDMQGRVIMNENIGGKTYCSLSTQWIANGMYFIQIQGNRNTKTHTWIKN